MLRLQLCMLCIASPVVMTVFSLFFQQKPCYDIGFRLGLLD